MISGPLHLHDVGFGRRPAVHPLPVVYEPAKQTPRLDLAELSVTMRSFKQLVADLRFSAHTAPHDTQRRCASRAHRNLSDRDPKGRPIRFCPHQPSSWTRRRKARGLDIGGSLRVV